MKKKQLIVKHDVYGEGGIVSTQLELTAESIAQKLESLSTSAERESYIAGVIMEGYPEHIIDEGIRIYTRMRLMPVGDVSKNKDDEKDDDDEKNQKGDGLFKRDVGTLPPPVRSLLEQIKDEKITSVQAWRYPLMKGLQEIVKKVVKLPYDSIFHLGLNLNGKYNLEKDIILKFTKAGQKSDKPDNKSKVIKVNKDITFGQLFDGLQKKMGDKFTEYDSRTNNCQDFSLAILSVLGIDDADLKKFIKQDAEQIYKSFGIWGKIVEGLSSLNTLKGQVVDRLKYGEGSDELQPHNNYLPLVQISFK